MIKFFRRIRQNLLSQGGTDKPPSSGDRPNSRAGKYLLYAFGEILLVVIGILIALQINNWNERRKELSNERKVLTTLNAEFSRNRITLDSILIQLKIIEQSLSFVFQKIEPNPDIDFSAIQLDSILSNTFSNPYWRRSEYTLRNLESSGKLSTITNEALKSKLYDWSLVATDIKDKDSDASNGFDNLLNYYKENGSLRSLDSFGPFITEGRSSLEYDHAKLFSDIIFENIIDDYLVFTRQRIKRYQKAKVIIDQIIEISSSRY